MNRDWTLIWPYLNEALMLASAAAVTAGWRFIRRRDVDRHQRYMLTGAGLGATFFVSYVLRSLVVGDTTFGGPRAWRSAYLVFLQMHVLIALVAAILGIVTIRWALGRRFRQHRRVGPWTASLWLAAAATGLVVFLLLYVVFPPGPTHSVWRAITR